MSRKLFRAATSTLAALSLTVLLASPFGIALAAPTPVPAAQAPGTQTPFGRLAPLAPTGAATTAPGAPGPAVSTAPAPSGAAAAGAAAAGPPVPRVIVIDRNFIMQRSSAGKDMVAQTQTLSKQAETQFRTEEQALQTEMTQLQQQLAILAADVRDKREKDFVAKQQAFQGRVQQRQQQIQAGFNKAARQLEVALEPILQGIMRERGANMVLDRQSVIIASVDIDVTPVAVQRLDKALPRVKVELTAVTAADAAATAANVTPAAARP
jgi:outer membrane protein